MSSVSIKKEEVVVYSITLPGDPDPIVLRVPAQVAHDLWTELDDIFSHPIPDPGMIVEW